MILKKRSQKNFRLMLCLFIMLLSMVNFSWAQTSSIGALQLPRLLPPSPNASELGRVGNVPISLSTGAINYSIPMLSLSSGSLKINVGLSYNSGGIKVDQIASRAGLGWVLDAGGMINRTVYGDPDETSQFAPVPADLSLNTQEVVDFLDRATLNKDGYDTQPDVFSFNFNGYGGKFILNPEAKTQVIFVGKSNLKVIPNFNHTLGSSWTFKIIDPNGIIYYFGGTGATEKSRTSSSGSGCGKTYDTGIENAWYLNKIEDSNGDNIVFNYLPVEFSYETGASQTIVAQDPETRGMFMIDNNGSYTYPPANSETNCISSVLNNGVYLSEIISSKGTRISFSYISRSDIEGDKLLSKVEYGFGTLAPLKTFNLTYNQVQTSNTSFFAASSYICNKFRPYLTELKEWSKGLTQSKKHNFEYYQMDGLPARLSYAQDNYGYFNGQNNSTFLPQPDLPDRFSYTPANRESYAAYANYGMLSKITYPTGGSDQLNYESHSAHFTIPPHDEDVVQEVNLTATGTGFSGATTVTNDITLYRTGINITFYTEYSGSGVSDNIHQRGTLDIIDLSNQAIVYEHFTKVGESFTAKIDLPLGNYRISLSGEGLAAKTTLQLGYTSGSQTVAQQEQEKLIGGVRVANVNTLDPATNTNQVKSYRYTQYNHPTYSSGVLMRDINYFSPLTMRVLLNFSGIMFCNYTVASSSGEHSFYAEDGNHVVYTDVIESDGTAFENGGVLHQYALNGDMRGAVARGGTFPQMPYTITGIPSILEKYQLIFKNIEGSNPLKMKETFMSYKTLNFENIQAYQGRKNYPLDGWEVSHPGKPYDLSTYFVRSYWNFNDSTKVINYDSDGMNPVVSLTVNEYNNPNHLQLTGEKSLSSDGTWQSKTLSYPNEMVTTGNDATGVYAAMVAKNQISPLIEEQSFVDGTQLIAGKRTNYYAFMPGLFLPQTVDVLNLESSALETRIRYHQYNTFGNPLSLSMQNGSKVNYIWSGKGQFPAIQILNADYALIESTLGASNIASFYNLDNPSQTEINNLLAPLKASHPEFHITTTTYEPLVGVRSQTDAKGMTTFYSYDNYGRLSLVKDQDGNIVKSYCYGYRGEITDCNSSPSTYSNTAQSGSFTRNNCGTGGTGGTVTYTIPANTYSSTISQADANAQAEAAINAGGQAYANANATCTYYNAAQSGSFTRNNCDAGGTGGTVIYTVAANTYNSAISQADANAQAAAAVNAGGQAYANTNAPCTYYNTTQSGSFTRNNCSPGGTGGTVIYTVAANTYNSAISQADANAQAINAVNAGGQAYANSNAACTYYNAQQSGTFTKNNCPAGGTGGTVTYTVAAHTYSSTVSQADADAQASAALNADGQFYANNNAGCTYYNVAQSGSFTRNNCDVNGTGGTVTYTIAANSYTSTQSLADANAQAMAAVNAGGQAYANANAGCIYYNTAQSGTFTRNNCDVGGNGGTVIYTIPANTYSSSISQPDANYLAMNAISANGQAYANANAPCIYYNAVQTKSFTRECAAGYQGQTLPYTIPAGTYSSTISLADANAQAVAAVDAGGQAYVNANGTCTDITPNWQDTYVKSCVTGTDGLFTGEELMQQKDFNPNSPTYNQLRTRSLGLTGNCVNAVYVRIYVENQAVALRRTKADIIVRFFSDPYGTVPMSVGNLTVLYKEDQDDGTNIMTSSITANGTAATIASQAIIQENSPSGVPVSYYYFTLRNSPAYVIIP